MKKNNFMQIVAAAAVVCGMVMMSSCSKDDDYVLPEVIESEVLDQGMDEEVKTEVTEQGTNLSYESWIMVKGQTRAAFENRVSVTLNGNLNNVDSVIFIDNYEFGECNTSVSYKELSRNKLDDKYVTVIDSALVYTVSYANFSFDFNLAYQTAVYDDGITRQIMPYHKVENVVDKGGSFSILESAADEEFACARRSYQHTITAEFDGVEYEINANIILKRVLGPATEPFIVKSEFVDEGVSASGDVLLSFVTVKQTWSDGRVLENKNEVKLAAYVDDESFGYKDVPGFNNDLKIVASNLIKGKVDFRSQESAYVTAYRAEDIWRVNYNYFSLDFKIIHDTAYYDDGVFAKDFPGFSSTNITNAEPEVRFENSGSDEQGEYSVYWLTQVVTAEIDSFSSSGTGVLQIVAR